LLRRSAGAVARTDLCRCGGSRQSARRPPEPVRENVPRTPSTNRRTSAGFGVNPVICRGSIGDRAVELAAHSRHWLITSRPLRGRSSSITPMSAGTGPHGGRTTHGFLPAPLAMDVSAAAATCEFGPPRRDRSNTLPGRGVRMVGLDEERIEATWPAALAV